MNVTDSRDWTALHPDLEAVAEAAERIAQAESLPGVLYEAVDFAMSAVDCDSSTLYVLEDQDLVLHASRNRPANAPDRLRLGVAQPVSAWEAGRWSAVVIQQGAYRDARFQRFQPGSTDRCEAFLSVPIVHQGRIVGLVNAQDRARVDFSERALEMIATVALMVGAEIVKHQLAETNSALAEKIETRVVIDEAKKLLQQQLGISEDDAYTTMRRQSQQKSKSLKDIAEAVILTHRIRNGHSKT